MIEICHHTSQKTFTLESASEILPLIYRLTEETNKEVKELSAALDSMIDKRSERAVDFQEKIDGLVTRWHSKLERLGARPKGVWLADFDNGTGYFCWKFPETKILYYHGYQDGFTGRRRVDEKNQQSNSTNILLFHDKHECDEKGFLIDASRPSSN